MALQYKQLAKRASLYYVTDAIPGISRVRRGKGFAFYMPDGSLIRCDTIKKRILQLAVPPAYEDVWICPREDGHLQATGRDDQGRKQYRYHPDWEAIRDATKFEKITEFCEALPAIKRRVRRDMKQEHVMRIRVLAAMVYILEKHYIRIGNKHYAETHNTYGLSTLRKKHVTIDENEEVVSVEFIGKNAKKWHINFTDQHLVDVVSACEEIPGYQLFKYEDEHGEKHNIDSSDVNAYLQEISGDNFTAKDFRTWAACKECFTRLSEITPEDTERNRTIQYNSVVKDVASLLGHTVAVCKKSYLHPMLKTYWEEGAQQNWLNKQSMRSDDKLFCAYWHEVITQKT